MIINVLTTHRLFLQLLRHINSEHILEPSCPYIHLTRGENSTLQRSLMENPTEFLSRLRETPYYCRVNSSPFYHIYLVEYFLINLWSFYFILFYLFLIKIINLWSYFSMKCFYSLKYGRMIEMYEKLFMFARYVCTEAMFGS